MTSGPHRGFPGGRHRLLAALLAASCGGTAPPATSPSGGQAEEVPPPEATEAPPSEEGDRDRTPFAEPPFQGAPGVPAEGQAPPTDMSIAFGDLDAAATELESSGSDCAKACRALASMERARDRICELSGPSDPANRCAIARARVDAARERVHGSCGSCPK